MAVLVQDVKHEYLMADPTVVMADVDDTSISMLTFSSIP